ncbi:Na+/H+ antiporter NhaC family protein [Vulgatibacter sp.]|uniref:Na+/H+ antiporter NhaC family protein n=1 Tax=Vulgatibacter sp. TaxID=1971226 RepID=UPI003561F610
MYRPTRREIVRWGIAAAILAFAFLSLPRLQEEARTATVSAALDEAVAELDEKLVTERPDLRGKFPARLYLDGKMARDVEDVVRSRVGAAPHLHLSASGRTLHVFVSERADGTMEVALGYDELSVHPVGVTTSRAPIRPWAVLPPLLAIVLTFATGRLVLSLVLSIVVGAGLAVGWNPIAFVPHALVDYGWKATFSDAFKIWIFVFTTALIGLVSLATRAGGVQGVVDRLARVAKGRRSAQVVAWLMGVAIFFDDYANTILVGSTMRPLTDRMRISREKLAYLVDSTSAPMAGIAVISTWIGYEVGLLGDLAQGLGLGMDGYGMFFAALPFRFYCMFTLIFVGVLVLSGRDFGPMLRAERRALETGAVLRDGATPLTSAGFKSTEPKEGVPRLAHVAVVPVAVVLAVTVIGLLWDGGGLSAIAASPAALFSFSMWRDAFGGAENSTLVLGVASLTGSAVAFALVLGRRLLPLRDAVLAYGRGMQAMWLAIVILTLAWGIKAVCDDLGTSHFLVAGLRDVIHPAALPLAIFFLAALIAFATGTSWGTMGILIPTAAPLAFHLAGPEMMFLSLAAVLDGAIFGDHVSPISDTTVMSSIATGSDHLDHVRTQFPYATVTMLVAAVAGYGLNALGYAYAFSWLLGPVALVAVIFALGRKVEGRKAEAPAPQLDPQP